MSLPANLDPDFWELTVVRYNPERGVFIVLIDGEDRMPGGELTVPLIVMQSITRLITIESILDKKLFKLPFPQ